MQYLILIADVESQWATLSETEMGKVMGEFRAYGEELQKNGHFIAGHQLHPSKTARSIRTRNGSLQTTDGPYAETKEQLGGFYVVQVKDQAEAERVAARCPGAKYGTVELRPIVERGA